MGCQVVHRKLCKSKTAGSVKLWSPSKQVCTCPSAGTIFTLPDLPSSLGRGTSKKKGRSVFLTLVLGSKAHDLLALMKDVTRDEKKLLYIFIQDRH